MKHGVVIVAPNLDVRTTLGSWLERAGYEVTLASTFFEGKSHLSLNPDIVVCELKLGEYNGLHLAAHAQGLGIPTIVIGPADIGLERDANQLGALYMSEVRKQDLLAVVEHELAAQNTDAGGALRFLQSRDRKGNPLRLPGRSILAN